jgi:mlo protein
MAMEGEAREGRSLSETPTWAVATVITVMVTFGFFFHGSLKRYGKVKKK